VLEHRTYAENLKASRDNIKVSKGSMAYGVDRTVIMTLAGATNCKIDYNALAAKGDADMCTLFNEIAKEGEARGKAESIIETGLDCGLSENDILERLQKKTGNIPPTDPEISGNVWKADNITIRCQILFYFDLDRIWLWQCSSTSG